MAVVKNGAGSNLWTIDTTSNAGRVTLYDSSGNPIKVETGYGGNKYLGVCMNQDVEVSTLNSKTTTILTGNYWEGTSEDAVASSAIQFIIYSDKTVTITVYQGDGSYWDISDPYTVPAGYGITRIVASVASCYKIRVTNNSGSTASIRLTAAQTPIISVLPRSLTSGGNLNVSVSAEWQNAMRTTGLYSICTPRTIGSAATPQNLFVLQNPSSAYWIAIRSMNVITNTAAVNTGLPAIIRPSRGTTVSGGTSFTAQISKYQTSFPSPQATCLCATTADDAALTTITATAGTYFYQQCMDKAYTQVGWFTHNAYSLVPDAGTDLRQIIIAPGENLLVQATGTAIPANQSVMINCVFSEMLAL